MTKISPLLSRRSALMAAAALPIAGAASLISAPAHAKAEKLGPASAGFHRFALGGFEVTTLAVGSRLSDKPRETFGLNASEADFAAASAAAFIPADRAINFFTPTLVNTGAELVLFDTGLAPDAIVAVLAETLAEGALDPAGADGKALGRAGVWRTRAVTQMTTLLVLRLRYKLVTSGRQNRLLLAEEATGLAFSGLGQDVALNAEEALALGLVHEVVAPHDLESAADALALEFATGPQVAMRMLKRSVYSAADQTWAAALEDIAARTAITDHHPDTREGVAAFREKRAPRFNAWLER